MTEGDALEGTTSTDDLRLCSTVIKRPGKTTGTHVHRTLQGKAQRRLGAKVQTKKTHTQTVAGFYVGWRVP